MLLATIYYSQGFVPQGLIQPSDAQICNLLYYGLNPLDQVQLKHCEMEMNDQTTCNFMLPLEGDYFIKTITQA